MFDASCAVSIAAIAVTFCVIVGVCPVDGWTLGAMVAVVLIAICGVIHTHKEGRDGHAGQAGKTEES
jgi:predicted histidine transporter YuiF (NhaC family)